MKYFLKFKMIALNLRILIILLAFSLTTAHAQLVKNQLINSGEVLNEGINLHQDGKYKEAIQLYQKISRSDTNYHRALYELSLSYFSDSNYIESKKCAEKGLKLFPDEASDWFILMASAVDELGHKDEALAYYDSSLRKDPNKYVALFNKGLTYYRLQKYTEAKKALENCLMLNPYYSSAHYYLGKISVEEGNIVSALLCYVTNLLVYPENNHANGALQSINNIARVTDEIVQKVNSKKETTNDPFELLQEILLSKAALDSKYKLNTDVEDPISRQLQVVLEKLEPDGDKDHFVQQYYVPFYRKLYLDNKFNLLIQHIFRGLDIKSIKEYKKKHPKELDDFINYIVEYFNKIRETRILAANDRSNASIYYLYNNNVFAGKGPMKLESNSFKYSGYWEFYHNNGALKSKGSFNENESKEGEWSFYYPNGNLKENSRLRNDSGFGKSTYWFDNGILNEDKNYEADLLTGEMKEYYYSGQLKTISHFEKGKKQGLIQGYHKNGALEYESRMVDNIQDGKTIFYHPNGNLASSSLFNKGIADGKIITYHENGMKEVEGSKIQNMRTGIWESFYPSGKIHEHYTYVKDELEGEDIEYYENGAIKEKTFYTKGIIDKKETLFDEDGIPYSELVYEKGKLKEIHHFTKDGKEFNQGNLRKGKSILEFFNADGYKIEASDFSTDGLRDGKATYFYPSGKISGYAIYNNGKMNGPRVSYYRNGLISDSSYFKNDTIHGYSVSYYDNGKYKSEGWFVDGQKQGLHIEYNYLGVAVTEYYFRNDVLDGYMVSYSPNGKKEYEQLFDESWLKKITQFDSSNNIVFEGILNKGRGNMIFYHNNKRPYFISQYEKYSMEGKASFLFFDSSISSEMYYKNGELDSVYRDYNYGGKLRSEGKYRYGKKEGVWKYYQDNQKLKYEENYVNGNDEGLILLYTEDGSKDKQLTYKNGELEGPSTYYGENGAVAFKLKYHKGKLISYTYENNEGKFIPEILLKGGTGLIKSFYRNGNKSAEIEFQESQLNGSRKVFFTNGKPYIESYFQWGLETDTKKVYYPNGVLQREDNYMNDSKMGICKYFYPNGKLKTSEMFYLGSLNGPSEFFDENGKLTETRIYYYGVLQSVNK